MNRYELSIWEAVYSSIERLPRAVPTRAEKAAGELACRGLRATIRAEKMQLANDYEDDAARHWNAGHDDEAKAAWAKAKAIRQELIRR